MWTGDLHLARHVAVAGRVIRAVAALVVEVLELGTLPAFVMGTVGVAGAVGDPRDEEGDQLIAVGWWRCGRGGVESGHWGLRKVWQVAKCTYQNLGLIGFVS